MSPCSITAGRPPDIDAGNPPKLEHLRALQVLRAGSPLIQTRQIQPVDEPSRPLVQRRIAVQHQGIVARYDVPA